MKQGVFSFLVVVFGGLCFLSEGRPQLRLKSFKCTSSNKSVDQKFKCFSKTFNRNITKFSMDIQFIRPCLQMMVTWAWFRGFNLKRDWCFLLQGHYDLLYRSSVTPHFNSIVNVTFDFCSYLNGTNSNPATKWLFEQQKDVFPPEFFRPCPLKEFKVSTMAKMRIFFQFSMKSNPIEYLQTFFMLLYQFYMIILYLNSIWTLQIMLQYCHWLQ